MDIIVYFLSKCLQVVIVFKDQSPYFNAVNLITKLKGDVITYHLTFLNKLSIKTVIKLF